MISPQRYTYMFYHLPLPLLFIIFFIIGGFCRLSYAADEQPKTQSTGTSSQAMRCHFFSTQSLFQELIILSENQLAALLPPNTCQADLNRFERGVAQAYQKLINEVRDKTFNECFMQAQEAYNNNDVEATMEEYAKACCRGTEIQKKQIIKKMNALCVNLAAVNERILLSLYALVGHPDSRAATPLYALLKNLDDTSDNNNATPLPDTAFLLLSLIHQGDSSALDILGEHYITIGSYRLAHACYKLAYELNIRHADCALGNFYSHLTHAYPQDKPEEYFSANNTEEEYISYLKQRFLHYKTCWDKNECIFAQERIIHLLSSNFTINKIAIPDEERKLLLERAAQKGSQQAQKVLRRLYNQKGNEENTQASSTPPAPPSAQDFINKAILYEKVGELEHAQQAYAQAAQCAREALESADVSCDIYKTCRMKFIKCLIKRGDYERAQKLLRGTLINADHKDCIKGNLLLADIFHNYLKTPVIAEQCYLTATFMAIPENCPRGLILLYKQQETKEAWHEELIHAYQHEWHAYCKALLLEQKKECTERYNVYPEEFLVQSLNRGETLKALETLIKKQFYTHQELTQKIAMCAGDQTFKDAALALITQSQPPSS